MKRISLDGEWQLSYLPQNTSRLKHPDDLKGIETISALVPGNVELDLMRAGIIADPFYGDNVTKLREFESFEWWYERSFEGPKLEPGQTVELVFHGLDCLATIWLNGQLIGQTNNMLIEHRFDITELCSASNDLVIRLQSVVLEARQRRVDPCESSLSYNWEGMGIRKAPHMYGWDIAPRIVSAGIWRSVELEIHNPTEIWDLYYYTRYAYGSTAGFFAKWQFKTDQPDLDGFFLRFRGSCQGHSFEKDAPVYFATAGSCDFHLEDAKLWWPRGYGEANLYEVTCEL
ncbi:MAG: glycoside hydrolase family 2, partial [Limnochordia bacterium]|nr:glycoside hydrolase family 2 [Limnochordia bacterium]